MVIVACGVAYLRSLPSVGLRLDGVIAFGVVVILFRLVIWLKEGVLMRCAKGLSFIGVHSMNVFLLHTFVMKDMWPSFFKAQPLVVGFIGLAGLSVLFSMSVEALKKAMRIGIVIQYTKQCFMQGERS